MTPLHPHEFEHRSTNPTPDSESRGTATTDPERGDRHQTVTGVTADERGVSPVIGAVLMFGLVFALLSVLQTTAVPALNAELELQHSERVEDDVLAVGGAVDRVAATGHGESVAVEAGLRYPPRMFFVNPPPVAGTVRTTEPATVEVANARAAGETGDYWDGTPRRFESRSLVYSPAYNEYPNAPTTVHESWVAYDRFHGGTRPLGDRRPVDGRRITLVALGGQVSASARSVPLAVGPVSAPAHRAAFDTAVQQLVYLRNTRGDRIRCELPLMDVRRQAGIHGEPTLGDPHRVLPALHVRPPELRDLDASTSITVSKRDHSVADELEVVVGHHLADLGGEQDGRVLFLEELHERRDLLAELLFLGHQVPHLRDGVDHDPVRVDLLDPVDDGPRN